MSGGWASTRGQSRLASAPLADALAALAAPASSAPRPGRNAARPNLRRGRGLGSLAALPESLGQRIALTTLDLGLLEAGGAARVARPVHGAHDARPPGLLDAGGAARVARPVHALTTLDLSAVEAGGAAQFARLVHGAQTLDLRDCSRLTYPHRHRP